MAVSKWTSIAWMLRCQLSWVTKILSFKGPAKLQGDRMCLCVKCQQSIFSHQNAIESQPIYGSRKGFGVNSGQVQGRFLGLFTNFRWTSMKQQIWMIASTRSLHVPDWLCGSMPWNGFALFHGIASRCTNSQIPRTLGGAPNPILWLSMCQREHQLDELHRKKNPWPSAIKHCSQPCWKAIMKIFYAVLGVTVSWLQQIFKACSILRLITFHCRCFRFTPVKAMKV